MTTPATDRSTAAIDIQDLHKYFGASAHHRLAL